jgi:NAD(P)-dependent dehydrogenase (short-subunit alcohol dehydrogenase family)
MGLPLLRLRAMCPRGTAQTLRSSLSPLDLTSPEQIAAAAAFAHDTAFLINNASTAAFAGPFKDQPLYQPLATPLDQYHFTFLDRTVSTTTPHTRKECDR